ncbi:MAG: hypothetical protein KBS74_02875 [Clostridiales bacterium]|nr:hypothetical protein [Candidatus Cacconaster stercorequi]
MSNAKKHTKRVLVLSRNYNNLLGMARSLAGGDYDIELVRLIQLNYKVMKVLAKSYPERACRHIAAYHVCLTDWKADNLIDFLMELYDPERETLLIPCDDLALPWLDEHYDDLKNYYLFSSVDGVQGKLAELMNKQTQKHLVLDFGLPAADSHDITIRDGKYEIPAGIGYPCFLKPAVLVMGSKDHLKRCDNQEALAKAVGAMAAKFKDLDLLVEDYIDIKKEYAILGMSADGKVLLPDGCLQFVQGGHGSRKGIMAVGEVVSDPEILAFMGQLKSFVETLHYTGMFDVDALASDDGIRFCEINLRFGGSGYAITKSGVNFPRMYADYMLWGKPLPEECKLDGIGKRFVSEKILLEDVTEKYISREKAQHLIENADIHFLMDKADPEPYKKVDQYFRTRARAMMALKELYKKLRHR